MRKKSFWFLGIAVSLGFLVGCGGEVGNGPTSNSGNVPVIVTMKDAPPTNATVLDFSITVTGIELTGQGIANANLLKSPVTVQLQDLLTQSVLLANTSAPAGTYSNLKITYSNPSFTVENTSTTTSLNLPGSKTCATGAVCTVTPTLNSVSTTSSTSPFPLTLTANTPVTLNIDFNSNSSISATDFSVTPTVTVTTPAALPNGDLTNMTVNGQITQVGTNQLTVTDSTTGMPVNLTTNNTTTFGNFAQNATTCTTANTAACLTQNQNVTVNYGVNKSSPTMQTATGVTLQSNITNGVRGVVTSVNPGANQFTMVASGSSPSVTGITNGTQYVVTVPTTSSSFAVQSNGLTVPSGDTFTGASSLVVGQMVEVNDMAVSGSNLTADQVLLMPTQVAGTVSGVNGTNLTVGGMNGLFTGSGCTSLNVNTQTGTTYSGVTGLSGLSAGNSVTVGGLLYNPGTGCTLVGGQVAK